MFRLIILTGARYLLHMSFQLGQTATVGSPEPVVEIEAEYSAVIAMRIILFRPIFAMR